MAVKMTKAESVAMRKWTRVEACDGEPEKLIVKIKIGHQSFTLIGPFQDDGHWTAKNQAKWYRQMLGKALAKIARPSLLKARV